MKKYRLMVRLEHINPAYGQAPYECWLNLDDDMMGEAERSLHTSTGCATDRLADDREHEIKVVKRARADLLDTVDMEMRGALRTWLERRDTVNGYTQADRDNINGANNVRWW